MAHPNQRQPFAGGTQLWLFLAFLLGWFAWGGIGMVVMYALAFYLDFFGSNMDPSPGQTAFFVICLFVYVLGMVFCIVGMIVSLMRFMRIRNFMQ